MHPFLFPFPVLSQHCSITAIPFRSHSRSIGVPDVLIFNNNRLFQFFLKTDSSATAGFTQLPINTSYSADVSPCRCSVLASCFCSLVQQAFPDLESVVYKERGYLVTDEVFEALAKIGFSLDSPAFYTVCESFDQKKNERFRLDDFISLCIFLQSAHNMFDSFDTTKQGRVTFDLNQFVYCTANCRIKYIESKR
ncbi:uncharacterized protein LOC133792560 [Humulus lupulus]|uniref:uncharacterized protein LOC133792560 n=1 Tax=Humulus lupulus TaxID=3486 RepID=UPI002B4008AE|nr:uncharacterized protein LOC133792560 [Humulus lupulus]